MSGNNTTATLMKVLALGSSLFACVVYLISSLYFSMRDLVYGRSSRSARRYMTGVAVFPRATMRYCFPRLGFVGSDRVAAACEAFKTIENIELGLWPRPRVAMFMQWITGSVVKATDRVLRCLL